MDRGKNLSNLFLNLKTTHNNVYNAYSILRNAKTPFTERWPQLKGYIRY